jgi:threonine/homoserine/homoserine lactone efflux protein
MIHFLTIGTVLGLSAGVAPGPLLTLVISETLRHGVRSGIKVALAPIITDLPIILLTLFILSRLSDFHTILGMISLAGGSFLLYTGYLSILTKGVEITLQEIEPKSLTKGILANTLNPHPYLFWVSVGAPTMTRAMNQDVAAAAVFIISFYVCLVGSKVVLAILVGRSTFLLSSNAYLFTMRFLGLVLCLLAIILFRDGLALMKIL